MTSVNYTNPFKDAYEFESKRVLDIKATMQSLFARFKADVLAFDEHCLHVVIPGVCSAVELTPPNSQRHGISVYICDDRVVAWEFIRGGTACVQVVAEMGSEFEYDTFCQKVARKLVELCR